MLKIKDKNNYETKVTTIDGYCICEFINDYHVKLGTYATKERALEVLDEIQNILMPKISYKPVVSEKTKPSDDYKHYTCEGYETTVDVLETYVYKMPID